MDFRYWILQRLLNLVDIFYNLYLEVYSWVWPFWLLAQPFYDIGLSFSKLFTYFSWFFDWVDIVTDTIQNILSWDYIKSLILSWLPNLEDVYDWWKNWTTWVGQEIDDWWSSAWSNVKSYIDSAIAGLEGAWEDWLHFWNNLWPELIGFVNNLRASWDNFWTVTFPNLVDFTWLGIWWDSRVLEVQDLTETAFTLHESLWDGWQEIKDSVLEFFADPLDWLETKFTDWFLGKE